MSKFWSSHVERLVPYVPGEQPKHQTFIKLNTNENPYGPSPKALEAIRQAAGDDLRLYPDPTSMQLREVIGKDLGLDADCVFIGNGSDEVLAHAFNAYFVGKDPVLFADVTYSFYKTYAQLFDLTVRLVPLDDQFEQKLGAYAGPCGGVVIANPNAPTGIALSLAQVEQVLKTNPDRVVIIDEAYIDFGAESACALVPRYENLVVIQTFSKSRSLAGLRIGFAVAQPHLIEGLVRVKDSFNSYPVDRLTLAGAVAAWQDKDWFDETRQKVINDRQRVTESLKNMGFEVLPSAANFVFASHDDHDAETLLQQLRDQGILVRHFRHERIRNWLRISIGTEQECDQLLAALRAALAAS